MQDQHVSVCEKSSTQNEHKNKKRKQRCVLDFEDPNKKHDIKFFERELKRKRNGKSVSECEYDLKKIIQALSDDIICTIFDFLDPIDFFFSVMPFVGKKFYEKWFKRIVFSSDTECFRELNFMKLVPSNKLPPVLNQLGILFFTPKYIEPNLGHYAPKVHHTYRRSREFEYKMGRCAIDETKVHNEATLFYEDDLGKVKNAQIFDDVFENLKSRGVVSMETKDICENHEHNILDLNFEPYHISEGSFCGGLSYLSNYAIDCLKKKIEDSLEVLWLPAIKKIPGNCSGNIKYKLVIKDFKKLKMIISGGVIEDNNIFKPCAFMCERFEKLYYEGDFMHVKRTELENLGVVCEKNKCKNELNLITHDKKDIDTALDIYLSKARENVHSRRENMPLLITLVSHIFSCESETTETDDECDFFYLPIPYDNVWEPSICFYTNNDSCKENLDKNMKSCKFRGDLHELFRNLKRELFKTKGDRDNKKIAKKFSLPFCFPEKEGIKAFTDVFFGGDRLSLRIFDLSIVNSNLEKIYYSAGGSRETDDILDALRCVLDHKAKFLDIRYNNFYVDDIYFAILEYLVLENSAQFKAPTEFSYLFLRANVMITQILASLDAKISKSFQKNFLDMSDGNLNEYGYKVAILDASELIGHKFDYLCLNKPVTKFTKEKYARRLNEVVSKLSCRDKDVKLFLSQNDVDCFFLRYMKYGECCGEKTTVEGALVSLKAKNEAFHDYVVKISELIKSIDSKTPKKQK